MRVIAKAYKDKPLDRVVTGESGKVIYLRNPSAFGSTNPPPLSGVGFPRWAVFEHDDRLFESLDAAWTAGDREALIDLWKQATPFEMAA